MNDREFVLPLTDADLLTAWRLHPYLVRHLWEGASAELWHRDGEHPPYVAFLNRKGVPPLTFTGGEPGAVVRALYAAIVEHAPGDWLAANRSE